MAYKKSTIRPIRDDLDALSDAVDDALVEELKDFSNYSCGEFKGMIEMQTFRSFAEEPLSPDYLDFKERNNLDLRTMIATSNYLNHIRVHQEKAVSAKQAVGYRRAKGPQPDEIPNYFISFLPNEMTLDRKGEETDFPLWELALVHEYGSLNHRIPPRPHWGPYLRRMQRRVPTVRRRLRDRILSDLRKAG